MNLKGLLDNVLVFDIETFANYKDGQEVNINTNFDDYVAIAQTKWIGIYSYKYNKEYYLNVTNKIDAEKAKKLFLDHKVIVGFNSEEFDFPILCNNGFINRDQYYNQVDCMKVLGASRFKDKKGFKYKGRGELMGYKFKKNSLECMAKTMGLEFQKSTIDYKIFQKNTWIEEEEKEIITYLRNDVMATKELFEKLYEYWQPFTDLIDWKDVTNFSWIKSSIASLIYKSACYQMGVEATYGEGKHEKEEGGGNVFLPKYEEARDVYYLDVSAMYPHLFCMFNLFSEVDKDTPNAWHGNSLFKVEGYYDISVKHPLTKIVETKLKQRKELKKCDPNNPLCYTIKIFNNGLYGVVRSPIFEQIHKPNAGKDCCSLGRQFQKFMVDELEKFGYEGIYGDTDGCKVICPTKKHKDIHFVKRCLKSIVDKIFANVPFSVETFGIDVECFIDYILFPFSDEHLVTADEKEEIKAKNTDIFDFTIDDKGKKIITRKEDGVVVKEGNRYKRERKGKKKNYAYIKTDKSGNKELVIVGLPIKKDTATPLGCKIFKEELEPKILKQGHGKFTKDYVDGLITEYLKDEEILKLCAVEYKVNEFGSYKIQKGKSEPTGIHAQISKGYFGGGAGVISLIKNNKIGNAGKTYRYCTVEEARKANLTVEDIDLEKTYNELTPFIKE